MAPGGNLLFVVLAAALARATPPQVAYAENGVLHIATSAGIVVRTIKTSVPICDFAVARDFSKVVFVPCNTNRYGGELHILDLKTGEVERLTHGPYWTTDVTEATDNDELLREVYANPEFSPDGSRIVFAVRDIPADGGDTDAIEASGPLATMDLDTRRVQILKSTLDVSVHEPAFANHPKWSLDGRQILVSFESGYAVVPSDGTTLRELDPTDLPDDSNWSTAFGWVTDRCILTALGRDGNVGLVGIQLLTSRHPEPASKWLGFALENQQDIESVQVSGNFALVCSEKQCQVFDLRSRHSLGRFPGGARFAQTTQCPLIQCR